VSGIGAYFLCHEISRRKKVALSLELREERAEELPACWGKRAQRFTVRGRSSRIEPNTSKHHYASRPETIEETAELVSAAGGTGNARCGVDHTVDAEVAALSSASSANRSVGTSWSTFSRDSGGLVRAPFWKLPLDDGRALRGRLDLAPRGYLVPAARLMVKRKSDWWSRSSSRLHRPSRTFFLDLMEIALKRLSYAMAFELAPHGVSAVALRPDSCAPRRFSRLRRHGGELEEGSRIRRRSPSAGADRRRLASLDGRSRAGRRPEKLRRRAAASSHRRNFRREYGFTDIDGRCRITP